MKRVGNLWESLVSLENLQQAAQRALRGKRARPDACDFFRDFESNLLSLRRQIADRTYQPGEYRTFWISDPKPRLISAAPFRDRVVHHALVRIIEPVFESRFIHHSYACRIGKGNHRALAQFVEWGRRTRCVLKLDIRKFFPTIDHDILKAALAGTLKDEGVLWLLDLIIDRSNDQEPVVQWFEGDDLFSPVERRRGIPIGNLTSQFLANVYLDTLDHFIKERLRVRRYLRYVDDLAIFGDDKEELRSWRSAIREHLAGIRLRLNEGKSRIRRVGEGVEFLGFVVLPDRVRLNARNTRVMRRRLRSLVGGYSRGSIGWPEVKASFQAWSSHASFGDTWRLRRRVFAEAKFVRSALFSPDP